MAAPSQKLFKTTEDVRTGYKFQKIARYLGKPDYNFKIDTLAYIYNFYNI